MVALVTASNLCDHDTPFRTPRRALQATQWRTDHQHATAWLEPCDPQSRSRASSTIIAMPRSVPGTVYPARRGCPKVQCCYKTL
jgi:hypothetical protein